MYDCQILKDSISDQGYRLTTFQVTAPRIILAEINTHRMLSRNSASSRAIPVTKSIQAVLDDPFIPEVFQSNQKGMQAGEAIKDQTEAQWIWQDAMERAVDAASDLERINVTKGLANRLLEPFKWHTAIISGTDWSNFFALRANPEAQGEFQKIAHMMQETLLYHDPRELSSDEWHMPLTSDGEIEAEPEQDWNGISIGRSARVSYLTHDGKRDLSADVDLYTKLCQPGEGRPPHFSPMEHVARPFTELEWQMIDTAQSALRMLYTSVHPTFVERMCRQLEYCGNYRGWVQKRAEIPNEHDASLL